MRHIFFLSLVVLLLAGCKKEHGSRVDIYMLKSFTAGIDRTATPVVNTITNAILDNTPLVADNDIVLYNRESSTFTLKTDIKSIIQNYGPDKAFAVTVDKQVV